MGLKLGYMPTALGILPVDWEVKPIADLSEFVTSGSRGWAKFYSGAGPLFIRSQNVRDGRLDFSDSQSVLPPEGSEGSRTRVQCNDLLVTITGNSVGNVAWVDRDLGEAYISQHVGLIRLLDRSLAEFVCLFLAPHSPGNAQILASQSGQSKPGLNLKNLEEFVVALPSLPERCAIVTALRDMDALVEELERFIAKKRDLKHAAMQQLLTGQTRLPGFTGEWETKTLGELFEFSGGYSASRDQLSTEGYCYLHYGDIHGATNTFVDTDSDFQNIPKLDIPLKKVSPKSLLDDGDVVFVDASEDDEGTSRHVVVVNKAAVPFISGLHTIVAKCKTDELSHEYRRYCFRTKAIQDQFRFYAVGTKVSGISKTNIPKLRLPVPSVPEQTAIAAVLMDLDAELIALDQRLTKTRDLKQAMMQELLTGRTRLVAAQEVAYA
jgi:type I restriction enzyme S subunit